MSDTTKRPYELMNDLATKLVKRLSPACQRIEIAGSIRRCKTMCGDIEIILIPKHLTNLLGELTGVTEVDLLLQEWPLTFVKNGQKYKQFSFSGNSGAAYTVDLFIQPDPATWGVNFLIRTGSAEFSHRAVTPKSQGGLMPNHLRVREARLWDGLQALETPEEEDVFRLYGMDFIKPEARV